MGAFVVRQVDRNSGAELARFVAPNILAYEGVRYVLRQIFPPYDSAMTFQLGVSGANAGSPFNRPNSGGGAGFGPDLTFVQCTDANANEGGCYTQGMRNSFGYARQAVAFTASPEAERRSMGSQLPEAVPWPGSSWRPRRTSLRGAFQALHASPPSW